jgi:hypothetical protein
MSKKEDILKKVGINSTGDGEFTNDDLEFDEVTLSDGTKTCSFYTYQGEICILDDQGQDNDYEDYSEEDKVIIYNAIMKS